VTAHGTYVPQTIGRRVFGPIYRRAYARAELICVSRYTERQVRGHLPNGRTVVIPNGVDAERFVRRSQPDVGVEKGAPTILAVGQVKARKGYHILARALPRIREIVPTARMVFIGDMSDSAYCNAIKAQLEGDGLGDAVQWLARTSDETKI